MPMPAAPTVSPSPFYTEEHELFRQETRKFLDREILPHVEAWEEAEDFPKDVFRKFGEQGLLGLKHPAEYGGMDGDYFHVLAFVDEMARMGSAGLTMAMAVQGYMASPVLRAVGTPEQKRQFLAPVISGEKVIALGITEPGAGSDVAAITTRAEKDGDDYVITGNKTFITNGSKADVVTLAVKTDPKESHWGISLILVETDRPGFSVGRKIKKLGTKSSDTVELILDGVRVPQSNLLGQEGHGFLYIAQHFQEERLVSAALAVSGAQRCYDLALQYVQERSAFGRTLAGFQTVRHTLAEMATRIDVGRRYVDHCAWLMEKGLPHVKEISMAKLWCGEMCQWVVYNAQQLFGGYGYMEEYPIARAYRDLRLITIGAGTSEIMRELISKMVLPPK